MTSNETLSALVPEDLTDFYYMQLHITARCNLRCKHCYQEQYEDEGRDLLEPVEILDIIEQFKGFLDEREARGKIYFSGGEPMLDPRLYRYITHAKENDLITMILSNGTLIDAKRAQELKSAGLDIAQVSLDGMREVHDTLRGEGCFNRSTKALDECHEAGIHTTVMVTLSNLNAGNLKALTEHCIKHDVTSIAFGRLVPEGHGKQLRDDFFTKKELKRVYKTIRKLWRKYSKAIEVAFHDPIWMRFMKVKDTFGCSAGIGGICIVENGDIMPCRRLNIVIGNIRDMNLEQAWQSKAMRQFRRRESLRGKCGSCKHVNQCGGCRAIAKAVNGTLFSEDPQCFL